MDTFSEVTKDLNASMKEVLNGHLEDAANKMIKALDKDGSEVLEWTEFKQFMHEFTKEQSGITDVIRKAKASNY